MAGLTLIDWSCMWIMSTNDLSGVGIGEYILEAMLL